MSEVRALSRTSRTAIAINGLVDTRRLASVHDFVCPGTRTSRYSSAVSKVAVRPCFRVHRSGAQRRRNNDNGKYLIQSRIP